MTRIETEIRYSEPQTPTSKVHEPREKVYVNGIFGGKKKYIEAVKELEQELYKIGA